MTYRQGARRARGLSIVVLCAAFAHASQLLAQALPIDGGRVQEQLKAPAVPKKPAAAPQIRVEPLPADSKADTPPFYVAAFRVTGATKYTTPSLVRLLGAAEQPLTLRQVQERADRITNWYKDQGYVVARAIVPAQDVRDGVVEIRVIEGRYERIDIANASDMSETFVRQILGPVREGALVHGPTLERAVLLISDLAGITPKATLEPGAQPGSTNLTLEITPTKTVDYDLTLDNAGSTFTGKNRLTFGATWNSPNNVGDRAGVRVITSGQNLNSLRASYDRMLYPNGVRGNVWMSQTLYELGQQFTALEANGSVTSFGGGIVYPWIRKAEYNIRLFANFEYRELTDRIESVDIKNEKSLHYASPGIGGDFRDAFFGGGLTAVQAAFTFGNLGIHTGTLEASDAATARTEGGYGKTSFIINRLQALTEDTRLVINYMGQQAKDNLDSSEKMSIGGISGVRAYPSGEAAGDDVHLVQAEVRMNAGSWQGGQVVPSAFIDYGVSRLNHDPWPGFTGVNQRKLKGAGLGLEWQRPGSLFVRGWYAHKLGNEPALADADSPKRVWVQGGMLF